jgi:hypothetical protein
LGSIGCVQTDGADKEGGRMRKLGSWIGVVAIMATIGIALISRGGAASGAPSSSTVGLNLTGIAIDAHTGDGVSGASICLKGAATVDPCTTSAANGTFDLTSGAVYPGVYQIIGFYPGPGCGSFLLTRASDATGNRFWDILDLNGDGTVTGSDLHKADGYRDLNFVGFNAMSC